MHTFSAGIWFEYIYLNWCETSAQNMQKQQQKSTLVTEETIFTFTTNIHITSSIWILDFEKRSNDCDYTHMNLMVCRIRSHLYSSTLTYTKVDRRAQHIKLKKKKNYMKKLTKSSLNEHQVDHFNGLYSDRIYLFIYYMIWYEAKIKYSSHLSGTLDIDVVTLKIRFHAKKKPFNNNSCNN